jgi:hypothetical protein
MFSNTTGGNNTAVGYQSLYLNTTASNNVAVGYQSGLNNTTGTLNVFVGMYAGYNNSTDQGSTLVGYAAGYTANAGTTSADNTFIGSYAGYNVTTGSKNTFLGGSIQSGGAGYLMTSGSKNTIVGLFDGNKGGLDIRTSSNYIVLSDGDGNPRGIFNNSGDWLVGTTSATSRTGVTAKIVSSAVSSQDAISAQINNNSYFTLCSHVTTTSGTRYHIGFGDGTTWAERGTISTNGTGTSYNTASDYRLKNITGPVTNSGAYIDSLKPVEGTWKADGSVFVGLIAHEAQSVSRTAVATGEKDGERMQAMDYSNSEFIANIIAELQSLRARVAQLETKGA